jgi:hypothetical protein
MPWEPAATPEIQLVFGLSKEELRTTFGPSCPIDQIAEKYINIHLRLLAYIATGIIKDYSTIRALYTKNNCFKELALVETPTVSPLDTTCRQKRAISGNSWSISKNSKKNHFFSVDSP